jgi:acyl-CoA synthetase (NDP forming)
MGEREVNSRLGAIDAVFNPRSIAFVGASNNLGKWGFIIFHNLLMGGFEGRIYPVNPHEEKVLGLKAFHSVTDIPEEVDLAIFTIPAAAMPSAIEDCVKKRVRAGVVISAGFGELGEDGKNLEHEMVRKARASNMVLVGPNGQGIVNTRARLYPWMPAYIPSPGDVAIISQSGNISTWLAYGLGEFAFGVSKVASTGNNADLSWEDYFLYLKDDPDTSVILAYVEGAGQGRKFFEAAAETTRTKPIVLLKAGVTDAGTQAAQSHTGVLAGDDAVFEAACRQAGIIRVFDLEEAIAISGAFVGTPLPQGQRVAIVTGGGGMGVMAADSCIAAGLDIPRLSRALKDKLKAMLPSWWVPGNPVDMVAGLGFAGPREIIPILFESKEIDAVLLIAIGWTYMMKDISENSPFAKLMDIKPLIEQRYDRERMYCNLLAEMIREKNRPVFPVSWVARKAAENNFSSILELLGRGIMVYPTQELAIKAIASLARYQAYLAGERE